MQLWVINTTPSEELHHPGLLHQAMRASVRNAPPRGGNGTANGVNNGSGPEWHLLSKNKTANELR